MLATVSSATLLGVRGLPVTVEVNVGDGLPAFHVVGLPDTSCREARDRVRAAFENASLGWPGRRITINLAPTSLRKVGSGLDLPIAVGILVASEQLPAHAADDLGFIGELRLDGSINPVPGLLSLVDALAVPTAVVPRAGTAEAGAVGRHKLRPVGTLDELVAAMKGDAPWPDPPPLAPEEPLPDPPDLADVRGQPVARFAAEVAAAGGHHLLLVGPPGAGKSMLAHRLPGLLPPLDADAALETTRIHSAAGVGLPASGLLRRPPMRAPHHTASATSVVGGGSASFRPGEVSVATNGVLFLDEMGEFRRDVLDALREPLEEGVIRVSRLLHRVELPARFILVGAMNPCPCGHGGVPGACVCSDAARARYRRRLSGPLLDRFDLRVEMARPDVSDLLRGPPGEPSRTVAERVAAVRVRAQARGVRANLELRGPTLDRYAVLTEGARDLLHLQVASGRLSARGLDRVRAVARTVGDLRDAGDTIDVEHVALALSLRADLERSDLGIAC